MDWVDRVQNSSATQRHEDFAANEAELGDAAAYGIYFDDREYNYMQHLRTVGQEGESYLVEAPALKKTKADREESGGGFLLKDLPEDALPSHPLDEASYLDVTSSRAPEAGLQPDLDPAIREVLEALDDEAYAADDGTGTDEEQDFFGTILEGGETDTVDLWEDDDIEDGGVTAGVAKLDIEDEDIPDTLEARVARFKAAGGAKGATSDSEEDELSEGGDTIAELRASSARRPPRRGQSAAGSQFSMTSSAMFRNEGLRTLDDRFDQVCKRLPVPMFPVQNVVVD